ncbi:hypothetical protein OPIT5_18915 [Opitutaceae bacterium TAV5]|nr:hypothetical protein OPIT5_18915 [Opitutaceae bacterium TAV5]
MKTLLTLSRALFAFLAILTAAHAQVTLTGDGSYSQSFTTGQNGVSANTMINDAGTYAWTDNSSIAGWYAVVNGSTPAQYRATNMAVTPTDVIYIPRASGTSGALGTNRTTGNTGLTTFGVQIVNNTGKTITELAVSYFGQQWQHNTGGADALTFQYSLDATSLTTGIWTTVDALTFNSLYDSGTGANYASLASTGGSVAPGTTLSSSITGLALASGATIWFRWVDENNEGVDQALSIDDVSITSTFAPNIPEPSAQALVAALTGLAIAGIRRWHRAGRS